MGLKIPAVVVVVVGRLFVFASVRAGSAGGVCVPGGCTGRDGVKFAMEPWGDGEQTCSRRSNVCL